MHKKEDDGTKTIALFSYQGHTGVTHFALLLASYFSSKRGKNVWYFEVGNQYAIESILDVVKGRYIGTDGEFKVDKVTFFPNMSAERARRLANKMPGVIIMDFGKLTAEKEELVQLCDERILMIDGMLWKQDGLVRVLTQKKNKNEKLWTRCFCFFGRGYQKFLSSALKEKIDSVPEITNPLCLKREDIKKIFPLVHKQELYITHTGDAR